MASCLSKLDKDITFNCDNLGAIAGLGEIDEAIIINSSDIATISVSPENVATVTMSTGKRGYVVNSVNNSILYQDAIKVNEMAPSAEEHTVTIKALADKGSITPEGYRLIVQQLLAGHFRVAFKSKNGQYFLAGAFAGLEASDLVTDTSTGGISTVTLKTPDTSSGDALAAISKSNYDALKVVAAS